MIMERNEVYSILNQEGL